jgi:endonuclease I
MQKTTLLIFIFLSTFGFSQIPNGYYNSATGLVGDQLRQALHNIIDDHTSVSYDNLWNAFDETDKRSNGKVWDIYTNCTFTFFSDQCGEYQNICDCYNREHTVPQSWFNEASPMKSDLFHVYPTDGKVNGYRSNYPYGVCANGTTYGTGKLGNCTYSGYTGKVFEPADEYKGDVARTYFYMATRYMDVMSSWGGETFSGNTIIAWSKAMFYEWHLADPVSQKEIDRNNAIYLKQHNRNPYIDHPEWVCDAFINNNCNISIQENIVSFNIFPNPTFDNFTLTFEKYENTCVSIYNTNGQNILSKKLEAQNTNFDLTGFQQGIYFIKIENAEFIQYSKIILQ